MIIQPFLKLKKGLKMKELIKNQISNEIFEKINLLEKEKNQVKQKIIAQDIINELDIPNFTPYEAYDNEGDIFIAMSYKHNKYSIEDAHWSGKHDVYLSSDDIHIEDEDVLKELKD